MNRKFLLLMMFILSIITLDAQTIRYVKPTASGSGNGSSWTNASSNLQSMINSSVANDQVWVALGTYKPTTGSDQNISFVLKSGVAVYGGFLGTENQLSQRNWSSNLTILSGEIGSPGTNTDNSFRVVYVSSANASTILDGFTIRDGYRNSFFAGTEGSGIRNDNSDATFRNCILRNNSNYYGAVANFSSSPTFANCLFIANDRAAFSEDGNPKFYNCTFTANGGCFYSNLNNTYVTVSNSIIWSSGGVIDNQGSHTTITYSIVENGYPGIGNKNQDPLFFNASASDVRLQPASPAINSGSNASVPGTLLTDYFGASRIQLGTVDMGIYEAPCQAVGDPTVFGNNTWNVYAWNTGGFHFSDNPWINVYSGYFSTSTLNFVTRDYWDDQLSPSYAPGYNGCPVNVDFHSYSAKRKGFPCGYYRLTVPYHDDAAQLFINNTKVWESDINYYNSVDVWTGWLGPNDQLEFRVTEGNGGSFSALTFTPITITCPGDITKVTDPNACSAVTNYTVTSTGTPPPALSYQFTGATIATGTGTGSGSSFNKGVTNVTVKTSNGCGDLSCSFRVTVTDNQPPILVGTLPGGAVGNVCLSSVPQAPTEASIAGLYSDNCGAVIATYDAVLSGITGSNCNWTAHYIYHIHDGSNNTTANAVIIYTGGDTEAPHLTGVLPTGATGINVCYANIPAGPTESDIAVLYKDNCGAVNVVKSGTPTGNNCSWTVTYHYVIMDDCSNTATPFDITYSGGDTEAPHLTGNIPAGVTNLNLCYANIPAGPSESDIAALYTDNCSSANVTKSGSPTGNNCNWTVTYHYIIKDDCGNTATPVDITYSGGDTEAPHLISTIPTGGTNLNVCYANIPAGPTAAAIAALYADNCSSANVTKSGSPTGNNCSWTVTYHYVIKDDCGNAATPVDITYGGGDNEAPTFTHPADITIPFITTCTYNTSVANTGDVSNVHDNCSTALNATFTDLISQCGYNTIIKRTWHLTDHCGNSAADQVQTITVTDNNTPYIVYAYNEAKFGEGNQINGSVGVMNSKGDADFKNGCTLPAPYFVKAASISVHNGATITNQFLMQATDGPNPPFSTYTGSTDRLPDLNVIVNNTVVNSGYNNVTIKRNVTGVVVTGSLYGNITVEQGAQVTFTPTTGILNVKEFITQGNQEQSATRIMFSACTSVQVMNSVEIGDNNQVNVNGPKVTFYVGDLNRDGSVTVNGKNTVFTANVYNRNGTLQVHGDEKTTCVMNGWFIVDKLNSDGKNIIWNKYSCTSTATSVSGKDILVLKEDDGIQIANYANKLQIYPNPGNGRFTLTLNGYTNKAAQVVILSSDGKIIERRNIELINKSNNITFDISKNAAGLYYLQLITSKGIETRKIVVQK